MSESLQERITTLTKSLSQMNSYSLAGCSKDIQLFRDKLNQATKDQRETFKKLKEKVTYIETELKQTKTICNHSASDIEAETEKAEEYMKKSRDKDSFLLTKYTDRLLKLKLSLADKSEQVKSEAAIFRETTQQRIRKISLQINKLSMGQSFATIIHKKFKLLRSTIKQSNQVNKRNAEKRIISMEDLRKAIETKIMAEKQKVKESFQQSYSALEKIFVALTSC